MGGEMKLFVAPVFCRSHVPSWQSAVPALRGGGPAVPPSAGFGPRVAARVRLCGAVRAVLWSGRGLGVGVRVAAFLTSLSCAVM